MKQTLVVAFAIVFLLCAASHSFADDTEFFSYYVTPDVWIIVDVSGSMCWDMNACYTWGDGSSPAGSNNYAGRDTDGDSLPNDSRMYLVKNAIHMLVNDDTINIRWGLSSFYQLPLSVAGQPSETHYRDAATYPEWWRCTTSPSPYVIPDMKWRGANPTYAYQHFDMKVQLAEGQPAHKQEISRWVDNNSGGATAKEFRADGGTPIACALRGVRYEYQSTIPHDNAKWCRGYYIILLTDGEATVGIDPATYHLGENALCSPEQWPPPQWMQEQCWWEAESLMNTYIAAQGPDTAGYTQIKTFVVGVGMAGAANMDSLARYGGTGHYYPATSPEQLQHVLRS
ncbi:hypothetical protein KA005_22385, partial [bacterium]|nr:hypothetical protein [bacterium]